MFVWFLESGKSGDLEPVPASIQIPAEFSEAAEDNRIRPVLALIEKFEILADNDNRLPPVIHGSRQYSCDLAEGACVELEQPHAVDVAVAIDRHRVFREGVEAPGLRQNLSRGDIVHTNLCCRVIAGVEVDSEFGERRQRCCVQAIIARPECIDRPRPDESQ